MKTLARVIMKNSRYIILLILFMCLLFTCKKEKKPDTSALDEASTESELALEQEPNVTVDLNDVVLPNGSKLMDFELQYDLEWLNANKGLLPANYAALLSVKPKQLDGVNQVTVGPQAIKNRIVCRAQIEANYLVNDSNFDNLLKNKTNPAQTNGLAYVYGSRDFNKLQSAGPGNCPEKLYGLDCSGMLMNIMAAAGINVSGKSEELANKDLWQAALTTAGANYSNIEVKSFTSTQLPWSQVESGDIIYYYEKDDHGNYGVKHIGIALQGPGGKLMLYQSNGERATTCEKNYGPNRGPRLINLSTPITGTGWHFSDYGVIRLVAKISGSWQAFIRCEDASTDAIQLELDFPTVEGGAFQATGSGTDYTGEPINVQIAGNYDNKANVLSGTITYSFPTDPTEQREDSFNTSLNYDDTGYTDLAKVIDNGGCSAQIELINLQSTVLTNAVNKAKSQAVNKPGCNCGIGHKAKN